MRLLDTTAGISTLGGTGTVEGSARASARAFRIPDGAEAGTPAELRAGDGRIGSDARAAVRLMVAHRSTGDVSHHRFADLPAVLDPGDVLVVNTSAVIPAALDARSMRDPEAPPLRLHLSTRQPGGFWVVEPRRPVGPGTERHADPPPADLALAGGGRAHLLARYPAGVDGATARLWLAHLDLPTGTLDYLAAHGQPIRYAHTDRAWPIEAYQTVFARVPGSAEMPSAARPFTDALVTDLVTRSVVVAPVTLHTGVSSREAGEPPYAEQFVVPPATAALVTAARRDGRRVIAVGTTAVRAAPERGVRVVDGLITGWHEPESSHLALLEAIAGTDLLDASYAAAVAEAYRWHEFGDSHLILP